MSKLLDKKKYFVADQKSSVHFYHLLQVEYDLQQSFKECNHKDSSIIEDILVAVAVWIKDSEINKEEKLSVQDIIALIVKILEEHNYRDVMQRFQLKSGFSILSKEQLYCRLNKVIKEEKIKVDVGVKTRVYQQLKKLGYETNQISTSLIRAITLQETGKNSVKVNEKQYNKGIANLPEWVIAKPYGHLFSSIRLEINIASLFVKFQKEDFLLDMFIANSLIDSFEQLASVLLDAKDYLTEVHYFSLVLNEISEELNFEDIQYYLQEKVYPVLPQSSLIKLTY